MSLCLVQSIMRVALKYFQRLS
uniref:Uncharacterized protein n=1 Tax=Anguilla anguilla TaxID=7936 RepID=A0A0E9V671_ANGAN